MLDQVECVSLGLDRSLTGQIVNQGSVCVCVCVCEQQFTDLYMYTCIYNVCAVLSECYLKPPATPRATSTCTSDVMGTTSYTLIHTQTHICL